MNDVSRPNLSLYNYRVFTLRQNRRSFFLLSRRLRNDIPTTTCTIARRCIAWAVSSYAATSGSIPVVDLADQIRWFPGSDRFAPAIRSVRAVAVLVESARSSSAGQIGVDRARASARHMGTKGIGHCSGRERSLLSHPLRQSPWHRPSARIFFSLALLITFSRLLPLPFSRFFFLPENQSEARCNARYPVPGRRASSFSPSSPRRTSCAAEEAEIS